MNQSKKIILMTVTISLATIFSVSYVHAQTLTFGSSNETRLSNSTMPSGGFSNSSTITNISGETLDVKTNKNVFQYGETIHLTINNTNNGPLSNISSFKNDYAGIKGPCGIQYLDFAFLQGNYTAINNYDELVAVNPKALNVIYQSPYEAVHCVRGYTKQINEISIGSNNATIKATTSNGQTITYPMKFGTKYDIKNMYGDTIYKQISSNQTVVYKETQNLPPGNYTIMAFSLSGKISKPLLIEIKNSTSPAFSPVKDYNSTILGSLPNFASISIIPLMFGTVMGLSYTKSKGKPKINAYIILFMFAFSIFTTINPDHAYAAYITSSQGPEAQSTTSSFTQATVVAQIQGIDIDTGNNNGITVQNNHFVNGQTIGSNYLWVQSATELYLPDGVSYNFNNCTTQDGSFICKLPTQVKVYGDFNYWTSQTLGACPSGWTPSGSDCFLAPLSFTITTVDLSSYTRIDLNSFQQLNPAAGTVYVDSEYRTCTTTCTSYTQLISDTKSYATSFSYYYRSVSARQGMTLYGIEGIVGQCGNCNPNLDGQVIFYDGTYGNETYTINSSGSPVYASANNNIFPAETNKNILWWDSISNSGGSNPTFTTTFKYGVSCVTPSSGNWTVSSSCTLTSNFAAPSNVNVQNSAVLTIPQGIILNINFGSNHLYVSPGSGVLILSSGKVSS